MSRKRKRHRAENRVPACTPPAVPATEAVPESGFPWAMGWVVLGMLLILGAARGELWFDEILSFQWARSAGSPLDLITLYRHDNNHPVNSLWIMALGDGWPPLFYRGLSVLAGLASLVLLHRMARSLCPRAAWLPVALGATSFPLVLYFSEARGYGVAVACALAAFSIVWQTRRAWTVLSLVAFWTLCVLGFLSHGSFLMVLMSLGLWILVADFRASRRPIHALLVAGVWVGPPALAGAWFLAYFLRPMLVAGGPEYTLARVLGEFFGYGIGLPVSGPLLPVTFVVAAIALVAGLALTAKTDPALGVFFGMVMLCAPVLSLVAGRGEFIYFRYFLVCLPFLYLLLGVIFDRLIGRFGATGRAWAGAAFAAFLIGQSQPIAGLLMHGRGEYAPALMAIHASPVADKTISSDQDLRVGIVVEYYRKSVPSLRGLRYQPEWERSSKAPTWVIRHSQGPITAPPKESVTMLEGNYRIQGEHVCGPVSGTHWRVYLREEDALHPKILPEIHAKTRSPAGF